MTEQEIMDGLRVTADAPFWLALMAVLDSEITSATMTAASSAPQHSDRAREFNAGRLNMALKLKVDLETLRAKACEGKE